MKDVIQGYPQPQKGQYKVYVRSITYNHSKYIVDCLNGVAMQQTDFPFVHSVYDDCSADGEQEVIKQWLNENCQMGNAICYDNELSEIVEVKHNTNANLTVVVYFFKRNLWKEPGIKRTQFATWREVCEYEAICEGDDYWIDPQKLQKQLDFLDQNPEFSCVHTAFHCVDEKSTTIERPTYIERIKCSNSGERFWYTMLKGNYILTCTFMMRTEIALTVPQGYYDFGIFLHASRQGLVGFIPDDTSAYRQTPGSIMNDPNKFKTLQPRAQRIIVHELIEVYKNKNTILQVKTFKNKKKATARMLLFCFNSSIKDVKIDVIKFLAKHPKILFCSFIELIFKKDPAYYLE